MLFGLLILAFVAVLVVIALRLAGTRVASLQRELAASRPGDDLEQFLSYFGQDESTRQTAQDVYEHLQMHVADMASDFPVRPSDSLRTVYGMLGRDIDTSLATLLGQHGWTVTAPEEIRGLFCLDTVSDLVMAIRFSLGGNRFSSPRDRPSGDWQAARAAS